MRQSRRLWSERLAGDAPQYARVIALLVATLMVAFFVVSAIHYALDRHPMSLLDEHVHYDTALKMHEGRLSYRGALIDQGVVREWACGVGHQAGPVARGCTDPKLSAESLPSGKYTSGYIHYPTYFVAAEGFRHAIEFVAGPHDPLTEYRLFSAFVMILGVIACGVVAYLLRIRGPGLVAAVTVPVAASTIMVMSGTVNPNCVGILSGALIAGAGVGWIRRGRGFLWLALATAFGASIAVVCSLPVGGFLLAGLGAVVARRAGWSIASEHWRPRLWQFFTLGAIVLAPVVIWGRYIAASATVSNDTVYGSMPFEGWRKVVVGIFAELGALHTPWTDWDKAMKTGPGVVAEIVRAITSGWPVWITVLIFGGLVFTVLRSNFDERLHLTRSTLIRPPLDPLHLLAFGTLLTVVLYPAALRVTNVLTFGIDVGIVARYSIAFGPLLILLLLLRVPQRATHLVLGAVGVVGMVSAAGIWL
ncbi:hypothetical protein [Leifsonia sp. 22587]|uniref:hypothetical protein n=1 Tax=Leifsonia sp. 22587 TaxID=3453946 RepID=UPI003F852269